MASLKFCNKNNDDSMDSSKIMIQQLLDEIREIKEILALQRQYQFYGNKMEEMNQNLKNQSKELIKKDYEISMLKAEVDLLTQGIQKNEYIVEWLHDTNGNQQNLHHHSMQRYSERKRYRKFLRLFNYLKSII